MGRTLEGQDGLSFQAEPSRLPPTQWRLGARPGRLELPPELGVVHLNGHRVLCVVGVPELELEELGGAQRGIDRVLLGDGQAQHPGDVLGLRALPVGGDDLQAPRLLCTDALLGLQDTGPNRDHGRGHALLPEGYSLATPTPQY